MPSKIRVLDEITINKIAAGEVIQNPASVVKELVENTIDAGSTDICVEIKGGGRQLIRVTDNGCGMNQDDALLCLERHATSKIREIDDIHALVTMGFRGEAVPSIASISKFTLLTCHETKGTLIIVDGGKIIKCSEAARDPGTTIEVKSLFFNVPVRKKFQRSPTYDANEILKVITIQALGHPEIKFQLISNQQSILLTRSQEKLGERISSVLGSDYSCQVDFKKGDFHIQGYIGLPDNTRHNRTGQFLFINKRAVFSPLINFAIKDGYGTSLPTNRHPVYVLHLTMPGSLVDVNVHPQKREVRLRQEQMLKETIFQAVDQALQQVGVSFSFEKPDVTLLPMETAAPPFELPKFEPPPVEKYPQTFEQPQFFSEEIQPYIPRVIATLPRFLLLEDEKGLQLVDQKAARSRIIYEKVLRCDLPVQTLLIPHTFEVSSIETARLKDYLDDLNRMGIQIEEFGPNTFVIHALPQFFDQADIKSLVMEIVNSLHEFQDEKVLEKEKEKWLALSASRATLGPNKKLSLGEAQSLVAQLMQCEKPSLCPKGKPTMKLITSEEMTKLFER